MLIIRHFSARYLILGAFAFVLAATATLYYLFVKELDASYSAMASHDQLVLNALLDIDNESNAIHRNLAAMLIAEQAERKGQLKGIEINDNHRLDRYYARLLDAYQMIGPSIRIDSLKTQGMQYRRRAIEFMMLIESSHFDKAAAFYADTLEAYFNESLKTLGNLVDHIAIENEKRSRLWTQRTHLAGIITIGASAIPLSLWIIAGIPLVMLAKPAGWRKGKRSGV